MVKTHGDFDFLRFFSFFFSLVMRARQLSITDSDKINTFVKVQKKTKHFIKKKTKIFILGDISSSI